MIGIVLIGVMVDHPTLTFRTLTVEAFGVLLFAPEAIVHPSFQMSFAATLALAPLDEQGGRYPARGEDRAVGWPMTAGGGARPPTLPGQTGVPAEMIVTDSSDTAAALAWTPVQGASSYRIWRAGADNVFRTVGETQGPSYGDHGLAPATPYAWQVTAVVGGIEQPPSPSARASTRPTSPRCDTPGSCQ